MHKQRETQCSAEPMQVDRLIRLSPQEQEKRRIQGICFYCGQDTQKLASCTERIRSPQYKFKRKDSHFTKISCGE